MTETSCGVKYFRDTDKCRKCPLGKKKEECENYKAVEKRFMDAWAQEVYEHGD